MTKNKQKARDSLKNANSARNPDLIYNCREYRIEKIPLNYRITIKRVMKKIHPNYGIDRDVYSDPEKGLDEAKRVAELTLVEYFQ